MRTKIAAAAMATSLLAPPRDGRTRLDRAAAVTAGPAPAGVAGALAGTKVVLAVTDAGRDPAYAYERRAAAELGATLVLSDRSRETWGESPHVSGPASLGGLRAAGGDGTGHLVAQMEEALALGVPDVRAVAPSIPNPDAGADAVRAARADVVVIPERLERPKLADRWFRRSDAVARIKQAARDVRVVVAHPDGAVSLVA